jgi:hypothetical protein
MEITADHINQYLDTRDDFDLELFAYRSLQERGWESHLGGTYADPQTGKFRQYDVRGRRRFQSRLDVNIAVECKSLSAEFPLVVSRVPRPDEEVGHDVLRRWKRPQIGDSTFSVERSDPNQLQLYAQSEMVGKSTTQIRWAENQKRLIASDAEGYDKWSQALASATEMVHRAATHTADDVDQVFAFIMPVLLVNTGTLWVVDYDENGRRGTPVQVDEAVLYVNREHEIDGRYGKATYRLSHLHIYTRIGFTSMLQNYGNPTGLMLDRTFRFAIKRALG